LRRNATESLATTDDFTLRRYHVEATIETLVLQKRRGPYLIVPIVYHTFAQLQVQKGLIERRKN
jgi:hypothetical protein